MNKKILGLLLLTAFCLFLKPAFAATCNFKSNGFSLVTYDTCRGNGSYSSIYGYMNGSSGCFKYQWTLNGSYVGSGKSGRHIGITSNGTYNLCVKVIDTCNKCDTTFCASYTFNCFVNCGWKTKIASFTSWDTCRGVGFRNSINASVTFAGSGTNCYKPYWTVNGVFYTSHTNSISYPVTSNGNYSICLYVKDSCNKICDTAICVVRTISCINACNWKARVSSFTAYDTCGAQIGAGWPTSMSGLVSMKNISCIKYEWKVDGVVKGNKPFFNYKVTKNGTYNLCLKLTDTCTGCDTTFCSTRNFYCFVQPCKWLTLVSAFNTIDTCRGNGYVNVIGAGVGFYFGVNTGCFKYDWKVNGVSKGGNSNNFKYTITSNGTYNVCLKITDTCNKCDTSICFTKVMNCYKTSCNWKARSIYFTSKDTCGSNWNLYGSAYATGCVKYRWSINGVPVANGSSLNKYVTKNGTYNVCVKLTDTCNNCDTTICATHVISCFNECLWKNNAAMFNLSNHCGNNVDTVRTSLINYPTNCSEIIWYLNGKVVRNNTTNFEIFIRANGTYLLCALLRDTCNKCDTTLCNYFTVSCIKSGCNWKSRSPNFNTWDTCVNASSRNSINGSISFSNSTCLTYEWSVNGVRKGGNTAAFTYPVTSNNAYFVSVRVKDSCNKCDTTFYNTVLVTCFTPSCDWKGRLPNLLVWDSCRNTNSNLNAYMSYNNTQCLVYEWKVNGNFAGTGVQLAYPLTQNGTYNVCVKATDTCNKCDTTICQSHTVNCNTLGFNQTFLNTSSIKLYPNPVNDILHITLTNSEDSPFEIVNVLGEVVDSGVLKVGENSHHIDALANGVYLFRIKTDKGPELMKFVVNR